MQFDTTILLIGAFLPLVLNILYSREYRTTAHIVGVTGYCLWIAGLWMLGLSMPFLVFTLVLMAITIIVYYEQDALRRTWGALKRNHKKEK